MTQYALLYNDESYDNDSEPLCVLLEAASDSEAGRAGLKHLIHEMGLLYQDKAYAASQLAERLDRYAEHGPAPRVVELRQVAVVTGTTPGTQELLTEMRTKHDQWQAEVKANRKMKETAQMYADYLRLKKIFETEE